MFSVILYQPEIPPNTGNIIRLCANTNAKLHLIEPLGFSLDEKSLKRAGLDYHTLTQVTVHANLADCLQQNAFPRLFALSSKGKTRYTHPSFEPQDAFLFGPETCGLPKELLAQFEDQRLLTLPQATKQRSLNLSNTVAIMLYEAWRQLDFKGL